jgi:hypothetical protein
MVSACSPTNQQPVTSNRTQCYIQSEEVDMVPLTMLWLPILISAVLVFIASNILWMALPFWHYRDYGRLASETTLLDALSSEKTGQYIAPCVDWKKMTAEEREAMGRRPSAYLLVRNPSKFSLGPSLLLYFLYGLAIVIIVACLTARTHGAGTEYLDVFCFAGTAAFLGFGFRSVSDSIWYGKPWKVAFKEMIDGLIYAGLIGGTFGWLWPR